MKIEVGLSSVTLTPETMQEVERIFSAMEIHKHNEFVVRRNSTYDFDTRNVTSQLVFCVKDEVPHD